MRKLLLEGPFESDYSLAIVNRHLARALHQLGVPLQLHERDNTTSRFPSPQFLHEHHDLAPLFVHELPSRAAVHSRYIYPPLTDGFAGGVRAMHCYGWEESAFPQQYVRDFNSALDLITVMSPYVRDVLVANGVTVCVVPVGIGADHILEVDALPCPRDFGSDFVFLHVSSCFPRKAPEVLVEAFCREFRANNDVRLVIKTFENPHNELRLAVSEADTAFPAHARIDVVWDSIPLAGMRSLYERANCLVSPSRGEGFGLPVAEAMLLGRPVIATIYSGQAETCTEANCWPVEYTVAPARSHVTEGPSSWAEPSLDSLRAQMRAVVNGTDAERTEKTSAARKHVSDRFTWRAVAARHWAECERTWERKAQARKHYYAAGAAKSKIGFITPWNSRCGIAEYTRYLANSLPESCAPFVFANRDSDFTRADEPFVIRCWTPGEETVRAEDDDLVREIRESGVRAVSVQFNFPFFQPSRLLEIVEALGREGIRCAVTLHSTVHENFQAWGPALRAATVCVCHRESDRAAVRESAGVGTSVLLPHGIPPTPNEPAPVRRGAGSFLLACFGFLLAPKGIDHLLEAFVLARRINPSLQLLLLNSLYPFEESQRYGARCLRLIQDSGLGGAVSFTTDFLEDSTVIARLAAADLVILPYVSSSESVSGAIRLPIASMAPTLCSDLPIFDEFDECVHRYPAGDTITLANRILRLAADPAERLRYASRQKEITDMLAWPAIAARFASVFRDK